MVSVMAWRPTLLAVSLGLAAVGCAPENSINDDRNPEPSPEPRSVPLMFSHVMFSPSKAMNLLADFNEDGLDDLLILPAENRFNATSGVYLRLGSSTELFGTLQTVDDSLDGNGGAVIADFNADNDLDIVLGYRELYMLPGNGDGTFDPAITLDALADDPEIRTPVGVDFDADGDLDVAAPQESSIVVVDNQFFD